MSLVDRKFFYKRFEVGSPDYPSQAQIEIPFTAQRIVISNESQAADVAFSFDGSTLDGELFKKDTPLVMDGLEQNKIWFKKIGDGPQLPSVRVWAWRKHDV